MAWGQGSVGIPFPGNLCPIIKLALLLKQSTNVRIGLSVSKKGDQYTGKKGHSI